MRIPKEALAMRVVVRRVRPGAKPYVWEIHGSETAEPPIVSSESYGSMEAAYQAGQQKLEETIPALKSVSMMPQSQRWKAARAAEASASA